MSEFQIHSGTNRALLKLLLKWFVVAILLLAFAQLSSEVFEGDTPGFDVYLLHRAHSLRIAHPNVTNFMRDVSALGSTGVLTLVTTIVVGYLALSGSRSMAAIVADAVISGAFVVAMLKATFGRARPDPAFAEMEVHWLSFPSGHATNSAIVYLTLGVLVAYTRTRLPERVYILGVSAVITCLVGVSRVALGVHWAIDVMAGWAFGTAWAMLWLLLAGRLLNSYPVKYRA